MRECGCRISKNIYMASTGWFIWSDSWVGLTSGWNVPPSCPLPQQVLPIYHQPKQNQADGEIAQIKINQPRYLIRWTTLYRTPRIRWHHCSYWEYKYQDCDWVNDTGSDTARQCNRRDLRGRRDVCVSGTNKRISEGGQSLFRDCILVCCCTKWVFSSIDF